jgi:hypothetical protein
MKLSTVVAYINHLDTIRPDVCFEAARREMASVLHVIQSSDIQFDEQRARLEKQYDSIMSTLTSFGLTLDDIKQNLRLKRDELEPEYLRESQRLYDHEMPMESNQYILGRQLRLDDHSRTLLGAKIRLLADWRLPGLIFRPGLESLIEEMVPLDPLYLVDQHQDLLTPAAIKFTPEYQRRLRQYVINERAGGEFLSKLPTNQFGFVFAFNYFNYKPLALITQYLDQLYTKVRPGGTVLMTFNDCDREQGVGLAERHFMCYTPARMLIAHAERVGFEVAEHYTGAGDVSWLELVKPGKIVTIRGGQTLATIVAKSK